MKLSSPRVQIQSVGAKKRVVSDKRAKRRDEKRTVSSCIPRGNVDNGRGFSADVPAVAAYSERGTQNVYSKSVSEIDGPDFLVPESLVCRSTAFRRQWKSSRLLRIVTFWNIAGHAHSLQRISALHAQAIHDGPGDPGTV